MIVRRQSETTEQKIILGFFRGLWWLTKLPFAGLKRKTQLHAIDHKYIISKKQEIEKLLESENPLELRHAVFEADKLVDWILKKRGYSGQTFADRLRSAGKKIPGGIYENIWQGHKVRNQIAHDDTKIGEQEIILATKKLLNYVRI